MSGVPLLEAIGVTVALGGSTLLRGVDLRVGPGEVMALVGPNGAGKSTLLAVLAGDVSPAAGTVLLGGDELASLRPRHRALRRAVLPQQHRMGFAFTVQEVVALGRHARRGTDDASAVAAALEATEMTAFAGRSVLDLSGGETARAALARTLAQDAPLLLLDEPTASLDLRHQRQVLDLCRRLAGEGRGIGIVLHDLTLAAEADLMGVVAGGRVVVGRPEVVLDGPTLSRAYDTAVEVVGHPRTGRPVVVLGDISPSPAPVDEDRTHRPQCGQQPEECMSVVKINAIEVTPGNEAELEARFGRRASEVEGMDGFLGFELLRPTGGGSRYFVYTRWESEEAFQAWVRSDAFRRGHAEAAEHHRGGPVAHGASLLEFEVVLSAERPTPDANGS